jgi:glycosyltransferase involved in cell wall biosynthesis
MSKNLVIVTGPLAPYRLDLYEAIASELKSEWKVTMIYAARKQEAHAWENLFGEVRELECIHSPGYVLPSKLRSLIGWVKGTPPHSNFPDWHLLRSLSNLKPDLIWIAEYPAYCVAALLYGVIHDIPVIVHTEVGAKTQKGVLSAITRIYQKFWGNYLSGLVACSKEAMDPFNRKIERLCLAPHAIDCGKYGTHPDRRHQEVPVVLFVGNLIPRKGIDYLAAACGILKKKGLSFRMRLVGGGNVAWAEELFRDSGCLDCMDYAGFREGASLRDEYSKASIFVLPSRHDTYGVVTHEAVASGLPVVISKFAGSSGILVHDQESGFVVDPSDAEELAEALEKLIVSEPLRCSFGARGRDIAERWSLHEMVPKVSRFLKTFA